ncbi:UNVERIFIED_CONTAM: hypothetical protein GTU68_054995 [Idotea baltica]|nr:hypothetical protein [Idotea baltica]
MTNNIHDNVKDYYGAVLESNKDLKTSACCTTESLPRHIKDIINLINPEIIEKYYGCGSPIPHALDDITALDLGCGSGRDCYLLSKLVGEQGKVFGIDMTDEQLEIARKHQEFHKNKFGYSKSNVQFIKSYIEELTEIPDSSVDLIVSNCVINLSPNKEKVFKEILRILKPGGELYFSDVYSDKRIPKELINDPVLLGECLSGALYTEDFRRIINKLGIKDFRIVKENYIEIHDKEIKEKLNNINFYSQTIRLFKLDLEDQCEDYGQVASYLGGIHHSESSFILDNHHEFIKNKPMLVCGNTADMLSKTRFSKFFKLDGNKNTHFGLFDCASKEHSDSIGNSCC